MNEAPAPRQAQYIPVQGIEYALAAGCTRTFRKHLLTTEALEIHQTIIRGQGDAEAYDLRATSRTAYVLAGSAVLRGNEHSELGKGHLIVIPAGTHWGAQLRLTSDELVLLEVARAGAPQVGNGSVRSVDPRDVEPYAPAGHAATRNRCLFADEHMEVIEGFIDVGGGAERHCHHHNEQLLYVLSGAGVPLLIHYPRGVMHGTGGGIAEPLELLVIYSPPLGESHNALS